MENKIMKFYRALGFQVSFQVRPGSHYTANARTTTHKQSDYKVKQSSFTQIALF